MSVCVHDILPAVSAAISPRNNSAKLNNSDQYSISIGCTAGNNDMSIWHLPMYDSATVEAFACLETGCTLTTVIVSDNSYPTGMDASHSNVKRPLSIPVSSVYCEDSLDLTTEMSTDDDAHKSADVERRNDSLYRILHALERATTSRLQVSQPL